MKDWEKTIKPLVIMVICISLICSLCTCRLEESYTEFYIQDVTDHLNQDLFLSDDLSFAKILDVIIVPEIREINHGEYIIYISAYAKDDKQTINVKKVLIQEQEATLFTRELNEEIGLEKNNEAIYEGWIDGGTFSKTDLEVTDGKRYQLIIEVEVTNDEDALSKCISYEVVIKGYKSFVLPT